MSRASEASDLAPSQEQELRAARAESARLRAERDELYGLMLSFIAAQTGEQIAVALAAMRARVGAAEPASSVARKAAP